MCFAKYLKKKHLANEAMIVYHFSESQTKTKQNKNVKGKPKEFGIRWTLNTILNIMHTQSYAGTSAYRKDALISHLYVAILQIPVH